MAQRYDTYKDSGVQWLGEIPGHWGCARLNKLASLKTGTTPKFFENELEGDTIDWYTPSDFTDDFKLADSQRRLNKVDFDGSGLSYVPSNSVLIIGIGGTAGKVACNKKECYSNQQITSLIPNERMYNLYMMLYFKSIRNILLETAHYTTLPILNNSFLAGVSLPIPPLSEQHAIVSYLDNKCGKIDEWVTQKQKEVEHLQELKQRVIADAVTRGINPNVTTKQTNIPWLPEIPEHWEMIRNKSMLQLTDEKVGDRNDITLLSLTKQGVIIRDLSEGKGKFPKDFNTYLVVQPNNLVFCLFDVDETPRTVGLVRNYGMLTGAYTNFEVNEDIVIPEYIYNYYLHIDDMKGLRPYYTGLRKVVKTSTFLQLKIPVPPLEEQKQIVAYITSKTSKIDKLITNINKEIENIKEYKQRLISDVVTGQIKVC